MAVDLGIKVQDLNLHLHRDSPFRGRMRLKAGEWPEGTRIHLLFPDTGVRWEALVSGVWAEWDVSVEQTRVPVQGARVELWIDGVALARGTVKRRGA